MKTQISLLAIAAIAFSSINACKKKKDDTPDKPKGVVICKVNGSAWQSGPASSTIKIGTPTYYKTGAILENDTLTFWGIRDQGDTSGIYFFDVPLKAGTIGTVNGTTNAFSGGMYLSLYDLNTLVATLGKYNVTYELSITAHDKAAKTITGNFIINMLSGKGNIKITEGEFIELKYK